MSDVRRPESREELDRLAYDELQALAADLGYGRIVGEAADDLRAYIDDELDLDAVETANDDQRERQEHEEENEADEQTVVTSTETDAVDVGHEGAEKLAPENAPDDQGTALEPPEDLNLDGVRPSDLEPETDETATATASDDSEPEEAPDDETEDDESGGLLSRIKGDSQRTSDEIVDDADSEEERERRRELKEQLSERMDSDPDASDDVQEEGDETTDASAGNGRTHTPNGVVMDESLVGRLIDMPFNAASAATGWEGWELDEREREANAELFVAMCDEHNVDLSPTVMFALSMGGTASGKALRYKRHKDAQTESEPASEQRESESPTGPDERDSESTTSTTTAPAPRSTSEAPSENREADAENSIF